MTYSPTSGSVAAVDAAVTADCNRALGAFVSLGGTHSGMRINFEGTVDGVNWQPLIAFRLDSTATTAFVNNTGPITTNQLSQWYCVVGGMKRVRARTSTFTSGSLNVSIMPTDLDPPLTILSPFTPAAALTDTTANPTAGMAAAGGYLYNGTTWDRSRGNVAVTVDTLATRTASGSGTTATNFNHRGAVIQVNVQAALGTSPTMTVRVQGSVDGSIFYDLDTTNAVTASITSIGQYYIRVYPGIPVSAAGSSSQVLPRAWRVAWTIAGTSPSFQFSTTASYAL